MGGGKGLLVTVNGTQIDQTLMQLLKENQSLL